MPSKREKELDIKPVTDKIVPVSLAIISTILVMVALYFMKPVLMPFVLSIFLYFVMSPLIDFLHRKFKLPLWASTLLISFSMIIATILLTAFIGMSLGTFISSSDQYQVRLIELLDNLSAFMAQYGLALDLSVMRETLQNLPILEWLKSISQEVVTIVGNLLLVLIFTFFLLVGKGDEKKQLVSKEVQSRITRYITTKFFTSLLTGTLVGVTFKIFGVQLAFMFGALTFFLNFIPNVGSIIAILIPLPILFLKFGYGWMFLSIVGITGAIQFAIGNILDPKLMGDNLGLHPAIVLLSLLFWGFLWGVPGMFLAVPITAILKLILSRNTGTKYIADLMEGKV